MEVGEGIWKKEVGKNASMKNLGLCHRVKGRIYTKKGKGILSREEREEVQVFVEDQLRKRIHLTFQVIPNVTSTLRSKEG